MALNAKKYASTVWRLVADLAVRDAMREQDQKVQQLATDASNTFGASGFSLPSGAIFMWDQTTSCPAGSTEVTALRNLFPMGWDGTTVAATGGNSSHTHTGTTNTGSPNDTALQGSGVSYSVSDAGHTHGLNINAASIIPPYRTCLFCRVT